MRRLRLTAVLLFVFCGCLVSHAQLTDLEKASILVGQHFRAEPNIVYKTNSNYEAKLDVYYPEKSDAPVPVAMMIHGGGWVAGTKEQSVLYLLPFLQMGFAVVNVEYRMGPVALAPAAVEDCLCALHWVGRNAKKYHFDLSKVVITGGSAGGHLALTTAMIPASAGFENECLVEDDSGWTGKFIDTRPQVAAVVNWFGITDVNDMLEGPNKHGYAVSWMGSLPNREDLAKKVSPLTYVRAGLPPILTIHGDNDKLVPYSHGVRLHQALTKAGVKNQLYTIPGGGHGGFTDEEELKAWEVVRAFLVSNGVLAK
ncbi:MAG TPA: alpha/beta hydrolase [Terriglobales bacterium]|jgi:acetyl esterase/lipase